MRPASASDFTGTWRLVRLALRRDRFTYLSWWLGLGLFVAATSAMFAQSLALREDLLRETRLVATNVGMRLLGLASGPSVGGYLLHREFVMLAVLAALMATFAVIRHTRQDEELGRTEVLASTVVGRYAALAAAVAVAVGASVVLGVVLGAALALSGRPAGGSFLAGASVALVAVVWAGVAGVACQLSSTARGAAGIASGTLGVAFVLSGVGNMLGEVDATGTRVTSSWVAWLSPIGWGQQTRPWGGGHWWPLLLAPACLLVLTGVAIALAARRDVGRGLWPERRGRGSASRALATPAGLVWRLQRGAFTGWAAALSMFGLIFGNLTEQIRGLQGRAKDWWTTVGGADEIVSAYQVSILQMAGMFVAIYLVQVLLRLRVDETGGTVESVLATAVTRRRWLLACGANAVAGCAALLLTFAVSMGLTTGQVLGDTLGHVRRLAAAGLVQLPGVLVVGGAVVVVVSLLPRWSVPLSWTVLLVVLVVGPMFGPGLDLPAWLQDVSPFTHSPKAPALAVTAAPLVGLAAVAVVLAAAGLAVFRHRDLRLPA